MTRINLVPPAELMDQHLIAEYREIRLLAQNMKRSFNSKKGVSLLRIPAKFTLNKGHVLFFADKGKYIQYRYWDIQYEMRARGFTPQFPQLDVSAWPKEYFNDWKPSADDLKLIRERIALRISQKPGWYRKTPAVYPKHEISSDVLTALCVPYEDTPEGKEVIEELSLQLKDSIDEEILRDLMKLS